ncbi:MAG: hypothetical protein QM698_14195 [Micropepsaceae bacterium]
MTDLTTETAYAIASEVLDGMREVFERHGRWVELDHVELNRHAASPTVEMVRITVHDRAGPPIHKAMMTATGADWDAMGKAVSDALTGLDFEADDAAARIN